MRIMPGINELKDKKVLLRCDFDIPVEGGRIMEKFRIEKQKTVIDFLLKQSSVVMIAHIKAVDSFVPIISQLEEILGRSIQLIKDPEDLKDLKKFNQQLYLLDNIRKWPGEQGNDENFAKTLAAGSDLYINNAFAVCHRKHASISAIAKFMPAYAGFLVEEEISQLNKTINTSKDGKIFIMGGAKASTKIPVIKNFIDKAEIILLGGVIANDILKARGADIGFSVADENLGELLEGLDIGNKRLMMPVDFNIFENKFYDIGPRTIEDYVNIIRGAKMIIWNGPLGLFEDERFSLGTFAVARAIASSRAVKTIGGGDTIAAVDRLGLLNKYDFVSTGGGAMLAYLAGEKLPGLEALGCYN